MRTLRALPEVSDDMARAGLWYNRRQPGLGLAFAESAYLLMEELAGAPLTHRLVYKDFRRGFMKRFPYAVYYIAAADEVVITLVFHTARNPATVKRLLTKREGLI